MIWLIHFPLDRKRVAMMIKRYENFDYLRGLAILAVVTIHVTAMTAVDNVMSSIIMNQVARFGVPVFIFLSGWGLTVSDSYQRSKSYFDFLKKRFFKLLPAYLLWNLVYLLFRFIIQNEEITLDEAMQGLIRGTNYPHLYFVPLIVLFYMVYPFILKLGKKDWGLLLSLFITTVSLVSTWGVAIEGFTRNHNPFNWLFYFVLGIWVAENDEKLKGQLNQTLIFMLLFLSLANVIFEPLELTEELVLTQTRLSVVFYSVMVIFCVLVLPESKNRLTTSLKGVSNYSFQIYLSHYLFIRVYHEWFPELPPILLLLLVLISSYALAKIEERLRIASFFRKIFIRS